MRVPGKVLVTQTAFKALGLILFFFSIEECCHAELVVAFRFFLIVFFS